MTAEGPEPAPPPAHPPPPPLLQATRPRRRLPWTQTSSRHRSTAPSGRRGVQPAMSAPETSRQPPALFLLASSHPEGRFALSAPRHRAAPVVRIFGQPRTPAQPPDCIFAETTVSGAAARGSARPPAPTIPKQPGPSSALKSAPVPPGRHVSTAGSAGALAGHIARPPWPAETPAGAPGIPDTMRPLPPAQSMRTARRSVSRTAG